MDTCAAKIESKSLISSHFNWMIEFKFRLIVHDILMQYHIKALSDSGDIVQLGGSKQVFSPEEESNY